MSAPDELLAQFARLVQAFPQYPTLAEKEAFKFALFTGRATPPVPAIALPAVPAEAAVAGAGLRRNRRSFAPGALALEQLTSVVGALRARRDEADASRWRYPYASAGALYGVALHLVVHERAGLPGVDALQVGGYRFEPHAFGLVPALLGEGMTASAHAPINRPIFEQAACSLHLVADFSVLGPVYGANAIRFAMIEFGLKSHLVDDAAAARGNGNSQEGALDAPALSRQLQLTRGQVALHTLLCGVLPS
ncbi:MAG: hypothetical protein NVSMB6_01320 [Burkholderiaceae bacterium]